MSVAVNNGNNRESGVYCEGSRKMATKELGSAEKTSFVI
jgi:hypothetical protein